MRVKYDKQADEPCGRGARVRSILAIGGDMEAAVRIDTLAHDKYYNAKRTAQRPPSSPLAPL